MSDSIEDDDFDPRHRGQFSDDDGEEIYVGNRATFVQNQPHDEEVALTDTESFGGRDEPPNIPDTSLIESHDMDELPAGGIPAVRDSGRSTRDGQEARPGKLAIVAQESPGAGVPVSDNPGAYNALEYKHLHVSDDVKALFQYINRYKPQTIELETRLKPFIPDYIPSVGGVDEFIKVPRPDGKPDFLGLKVLDEPAVKQSDPTVLTLQLRTLSKEAPGAKADLVGRIEHTDEAKSKKIGGWIRSVEDIHKSKPPAVVHYSKRMPDLEALMQEWPPEMEAALRSARLPSGDLDLDLKSFTKLVCSLLDIPVYDNPVESLHVLFSLYLEFKSNPVFGAQLDSPVLGTTLQPGDGTSVGLGRGQSAGTAYGAGSGLGTPWSALGGRSNTSAGSVGLVTPRPVGSSSANVMTL